MIPEKIYDVLVDFTSNNYKSILIDGVWGIGKTYQLNRFLKEYAKYKKDLNVLYISLFGKESIEDIHSELCIKGHPKQFKARKIMNYAFKTINMAASITPIKNSNISLDFSLGIPETKEIKAKWKQKKKTNIVILDDLERKNSKLNYDSILGYLNQLFLDNIKVVIICSEKEISKDDEEAFQKFKEKIFDRYYSISRANEDIIRGYFKEDAELLDFDMISLLDNNLRTASKVAMFYFDVLNILSQKNLSFLKESLLWYTFLVVISFNRKELLVPLNETDDSGIELCDYDEKLRKIMISICTFDSRKKHSFSFPNSLKHIEGLVNGYLYNDFESLIKCLTPSKKSSSNALEQEIFYLDRNGKKNLIKEKIKQIYSIEVDSFDAGLLNQIGDMYKYRDLFPSDFEEEEFLDYLAEKYFNKDYILTDVMHFTDNKCFEEILAKVIEKNKDFSRKKLIIDLNNAMASKNFNEIQIQLNELQYSKFVKENGKVNSDIKDFFITNNFFLPNLSGTLLPKKWSHSLHMCQFALAIGLTEEMENYLNNLENNSKDEDEKDRIHALLRYGLMI